MSIDGICRNVKKPADENTETADFPFPRRYRIKTVNKVDTAAHSEKKVTKKGS